jgi:hypothetical protein
LPQGYIQLLARLCAAHGWPRSVPTAYSNRKNDPQLDRRRPQSRMTNPPNTNKIAT